MAHRTIGLWTASIIVGFAIMSVVATTAFAKKPVSATRPAVAAAPVIVPAVNGPPADRIPRCFDSVILYPYPPCY